MIRLALCAALLLPISANADTYVACIQKQLSQLSIDVGKAHGLFGSKLRNGIDELRTNRAELGSLAQPRKENASVWCKELGVQFDLKSVWPSASQQLRIEIEHTISDEKRRLLDRTAREALKFLLSTLEVDVPGTMVILASTTIDHLVSLAADELQGLDTKQTIRRQLKAQCGNRDDMSGASYGGVVALCPNERLGNTGSWTGSDNQGLRRLIAHELSHEIHTQLIGNYRNAGNNLRSKIRGPKWLVEGTAIALERYPRTLIH